VTSQNLDGDVESRRKKEQGAVRSEMRRSDEGAILGGGKFEEMGPEIRWNRDSIPAIGSVYLCIHRYAHIHTYMDGGWLEI